MAGRLHAASFLRKFKIHGYETPSRTRRVWVSVYAGVPTSQQTLVNLHLSLIQTR